MFEFLKNLDKDIQQTLLKQLRDLWTHTDLGSFSGSYTGNNIPSHGVMLLLGIVFLAIGLRRFQKRFA